MMKINKKYSIVAIALIAIMCTGVAAYAAFTVYSNEVHVKVAYTLSLDASLSGSKVTLTAHLESSGNPVGGVTIYFYSWNGASWDYIGQGTTAESDHGNAHFDYVVSGNGEYDFRAAYDVP